jgi:hypothetical protein
MLIAMIWAAGFVIVGLVVPVYSSSSSSSTTGGVTIHSTSDATLVHVNGLRVLVLLALPLVAVAAVGLSLRSRHRHERPGAGVLAWIVTGLLIVVSILGVLTIGLFVAPVAVLLTVLCARAPTLVDETADQ